MFKRPFSFQGRIRRTEYGLSVLFYVVGVILLELAVAGIVFSTAHGDSESVAGTMGIFLVIGLIPLLWFMFAQGAKRCHDLGNSGWWQLIPLYNLWLLFQDGKPGSNPYGPDPKGRVEPMQELTLERQPAGEPKY